MPKKTVKKKKPLVDKALLDILACPVCKADVKLVDLRGRKKSSKEKKWDGKLVCTNKKCKIIYPIEDGIPIMLPPELR